MSSLANMILIPVATVAAYNAGVLVCKGKNRLVDWLNKRDPDKLELEKFNEEDIKAVMEAVRHVKDMRARYNDKHY